jgi:hypothetical protein
MILEPKKSLKMVLVLHGHTKTPSLIIPIWSVLFCLFHLFKHDVHFKLFNLFRLHILHENNISIFIFLYGVEVKNYTF